MGRFAPSGALAPADLRVQVEATARGEHNLAWTVSPFWALFLLGSVGIIALPLTLGPELNRLSTSPDFPPIPVPLLVALSLIQPGLLLAGSVALGLRCTSPLYPTCYLLDFVGTGRPVLPRLKADLTVSAGAGVALACVMALLDLPFALKLGVEIKAGEPFSLGSLAVSLLYGGVTEELMVRWGLLSLIAWAGWKLFAQESPARHAAVVWCAIVLSSFVFGLGHLPGVAADFPLTPLVVCRTLVLNGIGGIVFGWLFWRRSLESAIVAHASVHLTLAAILAAL